MTTRRTAVVGFFGIAILAIGVGVSLGAETGTQVSVPGGAYTNVTAPVLKEMLARKDVFFVNVHVPYEGEIAETDAFIPFNDMSQLTRRFPYPSRRDTKIMLYCQSGRMSDIAARALAQLGYANVWNLEGGMVDWKAQGYPLIQQERR